MSIDDRPIEPAPGSPIGRPTSRRDARDKVTGAARYVAEFRPEGMLHAVLVTSTVPAGTIGAVDTTRAEAMPGVRLVLTHHNSAALAPPPLYPFGAAFQSLLPLQDDKIRFSGQAVGLVVADTVEQATDAAARVRVDYHTAAFVPGASAPGTTSYGAEDCGQIAEAVPNYARGDAEAALAAAPVTLDLTYTTPRHYHCAMELHSTTARWEDDGTLTVWEPTQWTAGTQTVFAAWFKLSLEQVRVISPYVGGGFGSKCGSHPHAALAAMAARELGAPVQLVLTRPQHFTCVSPRPATSNRVRLGAERDGKLTALTYDSVNEVSTDNLYVEPSGGLATLYYDVPHVRVDYRFVPVNAVSPASMRAPGEAVGSFALESAMDELAAALGLDPIELRLRNYTEHDPVTGKPWSGKNLRRAYEAGARAFGWHDRDPRPGNMRRGSELIGWGMAGGSFPTYVHPCAAMVRVQADGGVEVVSGGSDLGTGTYTLLAQTVADVFGVDTDTVRVRLGDSSYPYAACSGGSMLAGSLTPVVHQAATLARDELLTLAAALTGTDAGDLEVSGGRVQQTAQPGTGLSLAEVLGRSGRTVVEGAYDTFTGVSAEDQAKFHGTLGLIRLPTAGPYSVYSWSAVFAEVAVDEDLGTIRLKRLVGAYDCGRVLNPITARSQLMGAMVMATGAALLEAGVVDPGLGRLANPNLAEYMLPVNADIPDIEVLFVGEPDPHANPLGARGIGEMGMTATIAAIANAVHHATGKRVRDLPILMEKML
ncbi:xanthine dehydrogenase family protein molybdopterin-binding subunit [Nonomuraea sp. NPDC050547]|uniref:xanthine dehydrogenase family protein molybdopterin-binding subunit n=1 Tax=Nonomuraea sp. NPDC050547 TaxID=3364368 RepID=UPI00379292E2